MDTKPRVFLELTNTTEMTLKSIEILTIFLKDEGPAAGSSRAHVRFDRINSVQPNGKAVISHRTWINGGVKFRGGDNSDLMTVQEAVDLASLLPREDHLAQNASKCPPGD